VGTAELKDLLVWAPVLLTGGFSLFFGVFLLEGGVMEEKGKGRNVQG
jgi:hypothetical protein